MDTSLQYIFFIILAPLAALIIIGLMAYARIMYPSAETRTLTWTILFVAGWLVFNALELADPTERGSVFWSKVSYFFIAFAPVTWVGFAARFAKREQWLTPSWLLISSIIPTITLILVWTNEQHYLFWTTYHFTPVAGMLAFGVDHGPWYWVQMIFSYVLVMAGAYFIIHQYFKSFRLYRQQSAWLVVGALTPIIVNAIYVFHLVPGWEKDYTSLSFAVAMLAFSVSVFRYHLFDLKPVAREAVVDSMRDAMIVVDLLGRVVDINPAAKTLVGLPSYQIIGQPIGKIIPVWNELVAPNSQTQDIQTVIEWETGGERRFYALRVSPFEDRWGRSAGRLALLMDFTARMRSEVELRRYTADLETSNQELDAFAHTVAHDLKNPLASLTMAMHLLRDSLSEGMTGMAEQFLSTADNTIQKMSNIIDALLILSSVRKMDEVRQSPVDTAKIVAEASMRLANLCERTQAEIIYADHWPAAMGYAPWIEEVWVNYMSNAIKYGGKPPRVELGADELLVDEDKPMVRFWARDNGPGLSDEQKARIFTPFSRIGNLQVEGHGLGLSIVLRIITKLGGAVGVDSQPGEGSRFWFTLPAASPLDDSAPVKVAAFDERLL